ncbi:YgjV family protein [Yangia mangrovi]|uniref:YgjV family protein n=1 Tax=Alloyangia mangrovi TaxID=1779329 RepID=A0A2A3JWP0_9RHOB|nr:YgjV family protein [Alloyangia mangrovi]
MLSAQACIAGCYAAQYALLGQWSGTGVCAIGATQTLIALAAGDRPWLRHMGLVFLPLVWLVTALTWCGLASGLAMTACCLVMIGRMQGDTLRMRTILLCAAPFGIGYDLVVGALPGLMGALLSACIGAAALHREWRVRQAALPAAA